MATNYVAFIGSGFRSRGSSKPTAGRHRADGIAQSLLCAPNPSIPKPPPGSLLVAAGFRAHQTVKSTLAGSPARSPAARGSFQEISFHFPTAALRPIPCGAPGAACRDRQRQAHGCRRNPPAGIGVGERSVETRRLLRDCTERGVLVGPRLGEPHTLVVGAWNGTVRNGTERRGVEWNGVEWNSIALRGTARHGVERHGMARHDMAWRGRAGRPRQGSAVPRAAAPRGGSAALESSPAAGTEPDLERKEGKSP